MTPGLGGKPHIVLANDFHFCQSLRYNKNHKPNLNLILCQLLLLFRGIELHFRWPLLDQNTQKPCRTSG